MRGTCVRYDVTLTPPATVLHMRRVQLQFTDGQFAYLAARAAASGRSLAAYVRDLVEKDQGTDEHQRRVEAARTALRESNFHSGLRDLSENHDEYFVQGIEERIGRR